VCFEHDSDWRHSTEYVGHLGPAASVVAALEASSAGRADLRAMVRAAGKLEGLFRMAAGEGRLLPGCADSPISEQTPPSCGLTPAFGHSPAIATTPAFGQSPTCVESPVAKHYHTPQPPSHAPPQFADDIFCEQHARNHEGRPQDGATGAAAANHAGPRPLPTLLKQLGQNRGDGANLIMKMPAPAA